VTEPSPQQTLAGVYDEGAATYEEYWAPALHRHARHLLDALPAAPDAALTVVDVATGAGTLVPALREVAGPAGTVIAADRSIGMLRRAPYEASRIQADAAALPLADATADVVVLAFVLFMLPDARAAITEAGRVLRPGGWLLAATWGTQLDTIADVVVREELDAAGAPPFRDLPRSDDLTDNADRMAALLSPAGFDDVRTSARPLDAAFDARSVLAMRTGSGTLGWRFGRLNASERDVVRQQAGDRLTQLPPSQFVDRSEVLLTTARKG